MVEKFSKTTGEKILEMMWKISGNGFKSDDKIDVMIDRFEDMVTERKKIKLEENFDYAIALQFQKRLENSGKINAVERVGLREVIEDVEVNPKAGDTLNLMKKKLRKMKVSVNREEPFKKEEKKFYVKDDNKARLDKWRNCMRAKGFVRFESNPK